MTRFEIVGMALKIKIRMWKIRDSVGVKGQKRRISDRVVWSRTVGSQNWSDVMSTWGRESNSTEVNLRMCR